MSRSDILRSRELRSQEATRLALATGQVIADERDCHTLRRPGLQRRHAMDKGSMRPTNTPAGPSLSLSPTPRYSNCHCAWSSLIYPERAEGHPLGAMLNAALCETRRVHQCRCKPLWRWLDCAPPAAAAQQAACHSAAGSAHLPGSPRLSAQRALGWAMILRFPHRASTVMQTSLI